MRKILEKKHKEEQEATAHAFQEFIKTFQDVSGPPNKLFVRSGILNPKTGKDEDVDKGKIYNPSSNIKPNSNTLKNAIECATLLKEKKHEKQKNNIDKPKSNLELLKEELRLRHMERDVKNKYKEEIINTFKMANESSECDTTTNLFVANINPKLNEQDLMKIFGAYGPLASVKIMWPRSEEFERNSSNCGFVAYMSRKDGERALIALKNYDNMRIGWGKPVEVPSNPIYIPPELVKLMLPPPYSGLPFNAQPLKKNWEYPKTTEEMQELLYNSVVKVTIPLDRKALQLIHRVIEFVINEGPLFEAYIMNNEINNPSYQFLFDNTTPLHVYYRWKLYSILQGENVTNWSNKKFRMYEGGSIWIPPIIPNYTEGMPECLIKELKNSTKIFLSDAQKSRLINHIQDLTMSKGKIGEAMVFCLNHSDAAEDIIEIIATSFGNLNTSPVKKIARLYLVSDILHNSSIKSRDTNFKNKLLELLPKIFKNLFETYEKFTTDFDKNIFKIKICKVIRAWDLWKIFPQNFLSKLESIFQITQSASDIEQVEDYSDPDEPLDGKKLIQRSLQNENQKQNENGCIILNQPAFNEKNIDTKELTGFIPSKWESIDPNVVESQAMSTKKFYDLELERQASEKTDKKKSLNLENPVREKLRQIEVMVMQYQDEIESGKRKMKKGKTMDYQLNEYRNYLLEKMKRDIVLKDIKNLSPISSDSSSDEKKNSERHGSKSTKSKRKSKEKSEKRSRR